MNKQTGGAAFPISVELGRDVFSQPVMKQVTGVTKRDYFAAKALQGFCANPAVFAANGRTGWALVNCSDKELVEYCGSLADAMLAERAK